MPRPDSKIPTRTWAKPNARAPAFPETSRLRFVTHRCLVNQLIPETFGAAAGAYDSHENVGEAKRSCAGVFWYGQEAGSSVPIPADRRFNKPMLATTGH